MIRSVRVVLLGFCVFAAAGTDASASEVGITGLPDALQPVQGTLARGAMRINGKYAISVVPEELDGLPFVTIGRGDMSRPGAAFSFTVDRPVNVYIGVQERGTPTFPEGWRRTSLRIEYVVPLQQGGSRTDRDGVWVKAFPAGRVEIPPHNGTDGKYYGLPHFSVVSDSAGDAAKTATAGTPVEGKPPERATARNAPGRIETAEGDAEMRTTRRTRLIAPEDLWLSLLESLPAQGRSHLRGPPKVEPLVVPPTSTVEMDYLRLKAAWCQRVWVSPFVQRSKGQPWAADAAKFVAQALSDDKTEFAGEKLEALAAQGGNLVKAGCDDALVLYLAGVCQFKQTEDWRVGYELFDAALKKVEADRTVSRSLASMIAQHFSKAAYAGGHPTDALERKKTAFAFESLQEDCYRGDEIAIFVRRGISSTNPAQLRAVFAAARVPEWAQHAMLGGTEIALAWKARGDTWADQVTEEGWQGFAEHMNKAREELVKSWELRPDRPEAAADMIAVVMGGYGATGDTERLWFDRTIAAQFDYGPAYSKLLWAYRPRWSGSHDLMIEFGKACLATKRHDTLVPQYFFKACNDIASEMDDCRPLFQRSDIARPLLALSQHIIDDPARAEDRQKQLSYHAVYAWLTGDSLLAARTLERAGPKLHSSTVHALKHYYRSDEPTFRGEVAIASSGAGADFRKAEEAWRAGDLGTAVEAYRAALQKTSPAGKPYIAGRAGVAFVEYQLESGDWVKLTPEPSLAAWTVSDGTWTVEPDGTLVNHGDDHSGAIVHQARIGPDFEMRGEFEIVAKKNCCQKISLVFDWHGEKEFDWTTCRIGQHGPSPFVARIHHAYDDKGEVKFPVKLQAKNRFLFRCQDGRATLELNGATIFKDLKSPDVDPDRPDGRVGFCSRKYCMMNTTYYRNLEVRRLNNPAPVAAAAAAP